jgi:spore coat protein U-like protein
MRFAIRSGLAALAVLLTATAAAHADGSVTLRGSVLANCHLGVGDYGKMLDLGEDLDNVEVASVAESCNRSDGYTVTLTSAAGGALVAEGGARLPYTVSYEGVEHASLGAPLVLTRARPHNAETHKLAVSVPTNRRAVAGTYQDTITLTIAAR